MNRFASLCFALVLATPAAAFAGGIFLPGVGPQSQARAGAFVAKADDPSALATNPAGIAKLNGTQIYVASSFIDYNLTFQRAGQYESGPAAGEGYPEVENQASPTLGVGDFQAVPLIAVTTDFGRPDWPFRFAAGLHAPSAYPNREFTERFDNGALGPQRFDNVDQKAETALASVAMTYSPIPIVDIGLRASWGFSSINATTQVWGVRNFDEDEDFEGTFNLRADDNFIPAFGLGVNVRPLPGVEVAIAYSSRINIDAEGFAAQPPLGAGLGFGPDMPEALRAVRPDQARCAPDRGLADPFATDDPPDELPACISVQLPQTLHLGARYVFEDENGEEKADIEVDVKWENWGGTCETPRGVEILGTEDRPCGDHIALVDAQSQSVPGRLIAPSVIQHFLRDTWSVRVGGSYRIPLIASDLELRSGIAYDTAAADEESNRVDLDGNSRVTFGLGAAYEVGMFTFELGGGVVVQPDRSVAQCLPETNGPTVPVLGDPQNGCGPDGLETPLDERNRPSPIEALGDPSTQAESPYNAGDYSSGYVLFNLGVTARL